MQVYMGMRLGPCTFVRIIAMSLFRETSKRGSTVQLLVKIMTLLVIWFFLFLYVLVCYLSISVEMAEPFKHLGVLSSACAFVSLLHNYKTKSYVKQCTFLHNGRDDYCY